MIKHILKLIWNKKRSNALMILEIFLAFIALFFVLAYVFYNTERTQKPLGFDTDNRWIIYLDNIESEDTLKTIATMENLKRNLLAQEEIEDVTFMASIGPFSYSQWRNGTGDNGFSMNGLVIPADLNLARVMNTKIIEGRWFNEDDLNAAIKPIIVNKNFIESYYPEQSMLDSVFTFGGERKLVGIVDNYRYLGEFEEPHDMTFSLEPIEELTNQMVIKLKPNVSATFEEKLSSIVNTTTNTTGSSISTLNKEKTERSRESWLLLYALLFVCGFLCINVALGLFGVLWYNISKRKSEIGLRQALGASGYSISKQFIIEMMILTSLALILGIFFAIQIPLLKVTEYPDMLFYKSIIYSSITLLVLVLVCALFPSLQAAKITPASSLHED